MAIKKFTSNVLYPHGISQAGDLNILSATVPTKINIDASVVEAVATTTENKPAKRPMALH
jgi:hypothetical protein